MLRHTLAGILLGFYVPDPTSGKGFLFECLSLIEDHSPGGWRRSAACSFVPYHTSSKMLRVPKATRLLTRLGLLTRESESSRPFFRATGATVMVAFGPQNLTCGIESAGIGEGNAVSL